MEGRKRVNGMRTEGTRKALKLASRLGTRLMHEMNIRLPAL